MNDVSQGSLLGLLLFLIPVYIITFSACLGYCKNHLMSRDQMIMFLYMYFITGEY